MLVRKKLSSKAVLQGKVDIKILGGNTQPIVSQPNIKFMLCHFLMEICRTAKIIQIK